MCSVFYIFSILINLSRSTAVVFHENCFSFTLSVSQDINLSHLAKYLTEFLSVAWPFPLVEIREDLMWNESKGNSFWNFLWNGLSFFQSPTNPVTVFSTFLPGHVLRR